MMNQNSNYLFYSKNFPAHCSIGAVVLDSNNKVMCHHFKEIQEFKDLYILMRETSEPNETIEQALNRGLKEEFGTSAAIIHYLGSIVSYHDESNINNIQKTTLYFLCKLIDFDPEKRVKDDPESSSEILFLLIEELKQKMKSQKERYPERADLDESSILNIAAKALKYTSSD